MSHMNTLNIIHNNILREYTLREVQLSVRYTEQHYKQDIVEAEKVIKSESRRSNKQKDNDMNMIFGGGQAGKAEEGNVYYDGAVSLCKPSSMHNLYIIGKKFSNLIM